MIALCVSMSPMKQEGSKTVKSPGKLISMKVANAVIHKPKEPKPEK
jgi:hypothetical protein